MPIYMKLDGLDGDVTTKGHEKWIEVLSVQDAIHRSIVSGAKDQQRMRGETSLSDLIVVRELDKSSVKLWEYCAKGEPIKEVLVDFCVTVKDKQEPYLKYKLENALISSYSASAASGDPRPNESVSFNFTKIEKNFVTVNPDTGVASGNVVGKYSPGAGAAS